MADCHTDQPLTAEECIARGDAELDGSDVAAALRWYTAATERDPSDFEAWTCAGDALVELDRHAEAAVRYKRAAVADPTDPDLHFLRATSLSQCGGYAAAVSCIDTGLSVLAAQPDTEPEAVADAWTLRGVAAFELGRTAEAIDCYGRALDALPGHEWALRTRRTAIARRACEAAAAAAGGAAELSLLDQVYRTFELPDCDGHARNPLWAAHLMHWLDTASCARLVAMAEAHAAAQGGWTAKRHAGPTATFDFEVTEAAEIWAWIAPRVHTTLLPTMAALFFHGGGGSGSADVGAAEKQPALLLRELFLVRYEAGAKGLREEESKRAGLPLHRDGYLMSFNLLLSKPGTEFDGGGTRLETLDVCACPDRQGDVFMHSGRSESAHPHILTWPGTAPRHAPPLTTITISVYDRPCVSPRDACTGRLVIPPQLQPHRQPPNPQPPTPYKPGGGLRRQVKRSC